MRCPKCNAHSVVLSTRNHSTRRRECFNGHRFTTTEMPKAEESVNCCPHGIHMMNACGKCVPPRGTT